ncbi:hypothetical protein [Acinetobacter lwoffii]|uniref:hypothetical protein n=1 Tax=Acinetobacter lwoffii TaxID=28090 RepID=UPI0020981B3A|nr:hypothetical protein [Acinetobacter lwoffii]MCO8083544.1 hypothetical protein [Acinetobacter lwoffii]
MLVDMDDFIDFVKNKLGESIWVPLYKNLNKEDKSEDGSLFSCLIPPEDTSDAMKKYGWDLSREDGGPSIVTCGDNIWYEPTTTALLPLVIYRTFHGTRKPYWEILQELVLYFNLYNDKPNNKYIVDNDNGIEIEVIKYSDNEILIRKSFLTAFMSARQMNLLLFFENTRHKITDESLTDEHVNERFISYTRFWDRSYVDGYKIFTRVLGKKLFHCLPREEKHYNPLNEKHFESFIIDGDSHDKIIHTCDPSMLSDYFGKNKGSPHYLTPVYFDKTVLQKYYSSSNEYEVKDSSIYKHGYWNLRFDNNSSGHVCVFLGDLGRDLPHSEQIYWKSFNISPEGRNMSKTYFERSMLGTWSDAESPDLAFKFIFNQFQEKWLKSKGWELFLSLNQADYHCFNTLHSLTKNEQSEFDSQILSLVKITIDSINVEKLKKLVSIENNGSIKLLAEFLHKGGVTFDVATFLGGLQGVRSTGVAHRRGTKYETTIARLGIEDDKLIEAFDNLLEQMTKLLIEIDEVFLKQEIQDKEPI